MNIRKYYIKTSLMAFIVSPVAVYFGIIIGSFIIKLLPHIIYNNYLVTISFFIVISIFALATVWFFYLKKTDLPEKASELFLPVFISFNYYLLVWILIFGCSKYDIQSVPFSYLHLALTIPYIAFYIFICLLGDIRFFPALYIAFSIIIAITITINCKILKEKIRFDKKIIVYISIMIVLCGITVFQFFDRSKNILFITYSTEQIMDEINYYNYHPFYPGNQLKKLNQPATISLTENYPRLDGATAAYPVYAAMVQELYKNVDKDSIGDYVRCSNTDKAYGRLIEGEIDIFFGAQPSRQQVELAQENGIDFILTPIAKEAFVFFVNKDNPVNSLTIKQIQDIYTKNTTNWRVVGGKNKNIIPFQRPDNSGSQTIMLARVMGDKILPPPLLEESASGMGGIISKVAVYRNYSSAIGYSFRYFTTGMKPNENIKLIAINGIEPSVANIIYGSYPFTVDVYAVTAGSENENTEKLIQWILSEQGQGFIETCGYIRLNP